MRAKQNVKITIPLFILLLCLVTIWWAYGRNNQIAEVPSHQTSILKPQRASDNKLGVHLLLTDGAQDWPIDIWPQHLAYAREAVGSWGYVLALVRLDDLDVARWQNFMDQCAALELTPMLRLATTHRSEGGWNAPPQDRDGSYKSTAQRYADFVAALEWPTTYETGGHYIIVGNEPNRGGEWGGQPDPGAYARFLIDVANAIHKADSEARILNAGLDLYAPHTDGLPILDNEYFIDAETFLDEMFAAQPQVFAHLDGWASHAYPLGPFTEGPWYQVYQFDRINGAEELPSTEPPPQVYNRGINGYIWELFKLSQYGVGPLPVFVTETGWRHAESVNPDSPDNGRPLPDAGIVSAYMDLALYGNHGRYPQYPADGWTPWLDDERVESVVFFAFNGNPDYWGHTNWLELDKQGEILGVYYPD